MTKNLSLEQTKMDIKRRIENQIKRLKEFDIWSIDPPRFRNIVTGLELALEIVNSSDGTNIEENEL